MPAQRPCASFEPIPPDLDLAALVEETPNFEYVVRISCDMIEHQGLDAFEKLVLLHVILGGKPLVIEGFQDSLDQWTFTSQWLRDNHGKKCKLRLSKFTVSLSLAVIYIANTHPTVEKARNLSNQEDIHLSISHYLNNMTMLTNQWNRHNYKDPDRQRVYLKDIDCPPVWHEKLKEQIPASVFYLNESTGDIGGPGAVDEPSPHGPGVRRGKGVARAGDLMSCLPPTMRADNMMCYIGHEGTYTPAHREMCASLGHNIMVETSGALDEDGKPARPGSSIWFMTETKDRHLVSEYWLSTLGHDIEVESHLAQINAWKAAPFITYVVEQKVGDFILIPPLAPHQVWNRGTRTMKAAWNRTTVETLEMALDEALPRARMVCRDEQYKNKAIVLFALQRYSGMLKEVDLQKQNASNPLVDAALTGSLKIRQLQKDFKRLFTLYTRILLSEMLSPVSPTEKKGQYLPFDSNVTCSYCRCNIFNRFLTCTSCVVPLENGDEDTYDICMECYAMGRSCRCISRYKWVEQFPWTDLVQKHELWRHQIIGFEGVVTDKSPEPLHLERKKLEKKTLAQVCQEQLQGRPWRDPTKPVSREAEEDENEEVHVNDDGSLKRRRKKRRSEKWLKDHLNCHICKQRELKWKLAFCECGLAYCYGSLFRAFDMMPLTIMEDPDWKCPRCRKICSCGACWKDPEMKPFEPNGTILGHDTKKIADPRSIESLVDFSHSNISWVRKAGDDHPHETKRLRRRRDEAARAKSKDPALDDNYIDEDRFPERRRQSDAEMDFSQHGGIPIDPQLSMGSDVRRSSSERSNHSRDSDNAELMVDVDGKGRQAAIEVSSTGGIRGPLPSVAAMLDGPPPLKQIHRGSPSAQASSPPTLSPEYGLSRSQHYPYQSPSVVGMNGDHDYSNRPPSDFVAPAAIMVRQTHEMETHAIEYQYPDPTLPQMEVAPSPQSQRFQYSRSGLQKDYGETTATQAGQKRKRQEEQTILRSDLNPPSQNDANRQFQQAQLQKTLAEAKKNDRYIAAQGALTGRRLRVSLPISKSKLVDFKDKDNTGRRRSLELGGDGTTDEPEDTIIVRSDVPQSAVHRTDSIDQGPSSHKRRARIEQDEDFSTRKPRDRRSSGSMSLAPNGTKKSAGAYEEVSDESGDDDGVQLNGFTAGIESKKDNQPRSRRLPAYLARRHQDEQEIIPLRLSSERKRRTSRRHKSPSPVVASNTASDEHSSEEFVVVDDNYEPIRKAIAPSKIKQQSKPVSRRSHTVDRSNSAGHDLSMLGAGESSKPQPDSGTQVEENQKAKLMAMSWAAGEFDTILSELPSNPDDEKPNKGSVSVVIKQTQMKRLPNDKTHNGSSGTPNQAKALRTGDSIFSRPGVMGKKVKIVSKNASMNGQGPAVNGSTHAKF